MVDVAGVGGYDPAQYLQTARERLASAETGFDLVIVNLFAGNDFIVDAEQIPSPDALTQPVLRWLPSGLSPGALFEWLYPVNQRILLIK